MENELNLNVEKRNLVSVEDYQFEEQPIKGYPELKWRGKHPFRSTTYFPAQPKESYGGEVNGWLNKIFWGDNLQVMSHLLKEYRGKIDLIYIDPPFDSKADYKMTIELRGKKVSTDSTNFEEKQYGDIWANDEYLQYMYERLILLRELLSDKGSIFLHCDWHRVHHLRCLMDSVFGPDKLRNEIIWCYYGPGSPGMKQFNRKHDNILWYSKSSDWTFNSDDIRVESEVHSGGFQGLMDNSVSGEYSDKGKIPEDWWEFAVASRFKVDGTMRTGYPTEKPYKLIKRIIEAASKPNDIVLDCFMGSGITMAMAMKLGRRFIGADINLGALETTTKRLLNIAKELKETIVTDDIVKYTGFEVFNVNNYDVFRNPVQAHELLVEALELQPLPNSSLYDGEKDGRMWKILSVNRVATRADLTPLIANFDYKLFEERRKNAPAKPVEKITLVCMGHEPDLGGTLALELKKSGYLLDVQVLDILRDKQDIQFRHDSEADIQVENGKLVIRSFYPMNLLNKLSMEADSVDDWRILVDSVKIDFNYDGAVFSPTLNDIPEKDGIVTGVYKIPSTAGTIRVKITDVLSESLEQNVEL